MFYGTSRKTSNAANTQQGDSQSSEGAAVFSLDQGSAFTRASEQIMLQAGEDAAGLVVAATGDSPCVNLFVGEAVFASLTAEGTETRCTGNPREFCRYNDNVPFIATVVAMYFVITCGRAFFMHFNR